MSGRAQGPVRNPTLRTTLFEAALGVATDAEVDAAIDAALAPYYNDPEPPMIGFRMTPDEDTLGCENCVICQVLNAEYGAPELVPLPDGTVLEIRRRRGLETRSVRRAS